MTLPPIFIPQLRSQVRSRWSPTWKGVAPGNIQGLQRHAVESWNADPWETGVTKALLLEEVLLYRQEWFVLKYTNFKEQIRDK